MEIWSTKNLDQNAFIGLDSLEEFYLVDSMLIKFESNAMQHLKKLRRLWYTCNQPEILDQNAFKGLENLEELDLAGNKLIKLESNTFQNLKKLRRLCLSGNQLESLDQNAFNA